MSTPSLDPGPGSPYNSELARLLDAAVERLRATRRTFTEDEALGPVWEAGYEVSPQSDARFAFTLETDGRHPRQWRLREQALANDRLLDALLTGAWDGHDLDAELDRLQTADQVEYVFCPADSRFAIADDGTLAPAEERERALPPVTRATLDGLGPALLEQWLAAGSEPWTVRQITGALGDLGWSEAQAREGWLLVRAWLLSWDAVARVGADFWLPADHLPLPPARSRLQVLPVARPRSGEPAQEGTDVPPMATGGETIPDPVEPPGAPLLLPEDAGGQQVRWTCTLRTVHLVEGFIPVPAAARSVYPSRADGEVEISVLRSLWFVTGEHFWIWLDRSHDRLYGPGLADQLGWCAAGDRLRVEWAPDIVVVRVTDNDPEVQREETRLVDLAALAELRGGRGESYRATIQALLEAAPAGLAFSELMVAVRERQGHVVHRNTVRALLHAGGFVQREGRWYAAPDAARSARNLRTAMIDTLVPSTDEPDAEPGSGAAHPQLRTAAIRRRLTELIGLMEQDRS